MPPIKKAQEAASEKSPKKKTGWEAVKAAKTSTRMESTAEFRIMADEEEGVKVQFLHEEPFFFDAHKMKLRSKAGKVYYRTIPCQLTHQKTCILCQNKVKKSGIALFKLVDFRGSWDSDKKKFDRKPVEKLWFCSSSVAMQIRAFLDKQKTETSLTEYYLEISRTGTKTDTRYTPDFFRDDDDRKVRTKPFKELLGDAESLLVHPDDEWLSEIVDEPQDDDDEDEKPRKKSRRSRDDEDDEDDDEPRSKKRSRDDDDDDDRGAPKWAKRSRR